MYTHYDGIDLHRMALRQMRRQMDSVMGGFGWGRSASPQQTLRRGLTEDEEAYTLRIFVPGLSEEQISIEATGDTLRVSAKREASAPEGYEAQRIERGSLEIDRSLTFPGPIDTAAVTATLESGILSVRVPKTVPERRKIEVQVH